MHIIIIGGTRFIGRATVERLAGAGHDVTVFHRGEREPDWAIAVTHIHGDRTDFAPHIDAFRRARPDAVIDMAPMAERDATAVASAFAGIAPRIVAISSVDVYRAYGRLHGSEPGPLEPMPLTEDSPLRERLYPYRGEGDGSLDGYDKIPAERVYMTSAEFTGSVVRLPAVHGERDYQRRLFYEVRRFEARRPYILLQADAAAWRWPRAYAGNVAAAIATIATAPRATGRIYNAPVDPPLTQREWLRMCARIAGWDGEIIEVPREMMPERTRLEVNAAQDIVVDDARFRSDFAHTDPFTVEDGVLRAMHWERDHPPSRIDALLVDFAAEDEAVARLRA